jgi:hypothetical protein
MVSLRSLEIVKRVSSTSLGEGSVGADPSTIALAAGCRNKLFKTGRMQMRL